MTQNMDNKPKVKRETKNKIRVEFERTSLKERLKSKYLSMYFLKRVAWFLFRLLLLIGIAFVVIQPFITMITKSIMEAHDFDDRTVVTIPRNLSLAIYKAIITDAHYFGVFFRTLGLSLVCALLQTFSCCLIGYGLAKFKFRGAKAVFLCVVLTLAIPHGTRQAAISHHFRYFDIYGIMKLITGGKTIDMMDTITPLLLLSATGLAFKNGLYIFMLRQFFRGVPDELEESAYLDGAGTFRTFIQVILPLSVPMMITVFLFAFCWQWTDDFYIPLFYTANKPMLMTYIADSAPFSSLLLSLQEVGNNGSYRRAMTYVCGLLACAPLVILYLFCQRHLVQGIERSGIVG